MNKIRSISRKLRVAFIIALIITPLINILVWMYYDKLPDEISMTLIPHSLNLNQININPLTKTLACLVAMLQVGVIMYALNLLIKLFKNYEQNEIFTTTNVTYYRRLGYSVFLWIIFDKIVEILTSIILTFQNPVGHRVMAVKFSGADLVGLGAGVIIILIAWIMNEGHRLQEDQSLTI